MEKIETLEKEIRAELKAVRKDFPKEFSSAKGPYDAWWTGYKEALKWVLEKIEELKK